MTQKTEPLHDVPVASKKTASHDSVNPPALLEFMMKSWRTPFKKKPPRIRGLARFRQRRRALCQAYPQEVLVIPTGHEKVRANDTHYLFRPGSDFYYLTGNLEPDCVLVCVPKNHGHEEVLFVEPNPGKTDATFFTDRQKGELWVGPRLGVEGSRHRYGVDRCESLGSLPQFLGELRRSSYKGIRVLRGFSPEVDRSITTSGQRDKEFATFLSEMRLIKDTMEVAAIERACASTRRGFEDVIQGLQRFKSERDVEGVFNHRARLEGNAVGYNTIAASGANACVLHWNHNHGALKKNELLLLDAGVEGHELYTADVTRTIPIGGKFTTPQRTIYDLVQKAQQAALDEVRPGNDFMAPNRAAMQVLAQGLEKLGILTMSAEEALRDQNQFYKRYSLHNVSHMLGIDVHDCAQARQEVYKYGELKVGMVLTVEPGLYFQLDDLTVPAKYRGIGVRIEDDVVVTKRGYRILSNLPRQSNDVEKWMHGLWRKSNH